MCGRSQGMYKQPVQNPIKIAGDLYLEYLEREHKKKQQQEQPGLYSNLQKDYFR